MDGPAFVSQCPIIPGNSFLYVIFNKLRICVSNMSIFSDTTSTFPDRAERTGIIRIFLPSTAMAFGEFNLTTFFCSVLISASSGPLVLYGKRA